MTLAMEYDEAENKQGETTEPVFSSAQEWVTEWFLPHFRRNPKTVRWDPQWWRHEEAGTVLEAMWGSWEATRATGDAGAMVAWFRDVFYPLTDRLTSDNGPFWSIHEALGRVEVPATLPHEPAPAGWFG